MRCPVLVLLLWLTGAGMAAGQESITREIDHWPSGTIYFARNSTTLTPEAQAELREQSAWLKDHVSMTCGLEGHTDTWGGREQNLKLGRKRAEVARQFLIGLGIAPERLTTLSYGEDRPMAQCRKEICWSQNRRVVTIVTSAPESQ